MNKTGHGFTLLEILIAMALFAIMSVMAYSGLRVLMDARANTALRSGRLAELQTSLYVLGEDLAQAIARPVRDGYGAAEPGMRGGGNDELLALTRSVPAWSNRGAASQLQRVSYRFEQGALYRMTWATLDRTQQSEYRRRKLIGLQRISIRFFAEDWTDYWSSSNPPKAVEIVFTIDGLGDITRLFFVHD
ncbi:MAG: type II secretion system minor pseudopilin GspJ [Methylovulum sp.]|nr:type II secretion system minor pseudopilin GspJ [Methylovulum sp.]